MTFSFLRRPKAPPGNRAPEGEEAGAAPEFQKKSVTSGDFKSPGGCRPQRRRRSLALTRGETSVDFVDPRGQRGGEAARHGRRSLGLTRGGGGALVLAQVQGQESTPQKTSQGGNNGQGVFARALTRSLTSPKNGRLPHGRGAPVLAKQQGRCAADLATSLPRDVWEAAEQDSLTTWGSFPDDSQLPARSQTLSNRSQRPEAAQGSPRAGQGPCPPPSLNPNPPSHGGNMAPAEGPGGVSQAAKGCLKKSASDALRERERARPRHRRSTCMESIDLEGMVEGVAIGGEDMAVGGMDLVVGGEDKAKMAGGSPGAGECTGQSPGLGQFCSRLSLEQLVPHSAPLLGLELLVQHSDLCLGSESQDKWAGFVVGEASLTFSPSGASDWSAPHSGGRGVASSLVFVESLDARMRHTPTP